MSTRYFSAMIKGRLKTAARMLEADKPEFVFGATTSPNAVKNREIIPCVIYEKVNNLYVHGKKNAVYL